MSSFYAGVIVCSIKPYYEEGDIVRFNEYGDKDSEKKGDTTGDDAFFLYRVREIGEIDQGSGGKDFEGTKISYEKAKEIIEEENIGRKDKLIPLFCVHGFSNEANYVFGILNQKIPKFVHGGKYYPVPVIWPCTTNNFNGLPSHNYRLDQTTTSQSAGTLFKALADLVPNDTWTEKSLLMHSMGNHVVFNGACATSKPDVEFDEIFMVAADIPFDCFHKDPQQEEGVFADKRKKAANFIGMLKNGGKIHVLHNNYDVALRGSSTSLVNGINRLGEEGIGKYYEDGRWKDNKQMDYVLPDLIDRYKNVDCAHKRGEMSASMHSYQFNDFAIDYYSDPDGKSDYQNIFDSYKIR